jgi:ankyrin repeat protein
MKQPLADHLLISIGNGEPIGADEIATPTTDLNAIGNKVARTPLMAAAYAGRTDLIVSLVEHGATIDASNPDGIAAIHEAAGQGCVRAVDTLVRLGADLEAETRLGHTPLMVAAAWGECDVINLLLTLGADPMHTDHTGLTAESIAREKGEFKAASILEQAIQSMKGQMSLRQQPGPQD